MRVKGAEKIQQIIAVLLFLICLLIGKAEATLNLRFVFWGEPKAAHELSVQEFAKLVRDNTGGEIVIEIINGMKAGIPIQNALVMIQSRKYDGAVIPVFLFLRDFPKINTLFFPFLFADYEHVDKTIFEEIGIDLLREFSEVTKVKGLAYLENGFFDLSGVGVPIISMADLKGMKLRVWSRYSSPIFNALGASPTELRFAEVYSALQAGVVNVAELMVYNGTRGELQKGYEGVLKYVSLTEHSYSTRVMILNLKIFDNLRKEHKQAVLDSAIEASRLNTKIVRKEKRKALDKVEKMGIKVVVPDRISIRRSLDKIFENPPKSIDRDILARVKKKCRHPPFCGCDGKGKK